MWNTPTKKELSEIPDLFENENGNIYDAIVHMHFFLGGCDWYITEFDGKDTFYGFAILSNDYFNAEWGYVSFKELKNAKVGFLEVDRDLHWEKRPVKKVKKIMKAVQLHRCVNC